MIQNIRLQQFRSYKDDSFEFSPSVNIIVGPNASGKTNLLEGVLVIARGSSYRVRDSELIQFDAPWARLESNDEQNHYRIVKFVRGTPTSKIYEFDGVVQRRLSHARTLPVVLFEPNHLTLLSGSPETRRAYLDDLLEQVSPSFGTLRRGYRRTLAQRNALLKLGSHKAASQMFAWNLRLSELAGRIVQARVGLMEEITPKLTELYTELSGTDTEVIAEYVSPFSAEQYETKLLHKLEASVELDFQRGFTAYGPHREDMEVLFNGHPAGETASRGESRTTVLALKIIELQIIHRVRDVSPLLLLDDVFSELDGARRRALTKYVESYQSFITTTDADIVIQNFTETCNIIPLS